MPLKHAMQQHYAVAMFLTQYVMIYKSFKFVLFLRMNAPI